MKGYMWMMVLAGSVSACIAQDAAPAGAGESSSEASGGGGEVIQQASPWRVSGGLMYQSWLYEHDALQQRAPATSKGADDYLQGNTSGDGYGLQTRIGRGDGTLVVDYIRSDISYDLSPVGGYHQIDTTARDFEMSWLQIQGHNSQSDWSSKMGIRYLGMQKKAYITEGTNSTTVSGNGNINWVMLVGGTDGNWRPFETSVFQAHGSIHFFLAEANGTARSGSDTNWTDGVISETYSDKYSPGYGMRVLFGVDIGITKRVRLTVDYKREWLYSFDATDTGIVVFPDNSDALFIENSQAVVASLNYLF